MSGRLQSAAGLASTMAERKRAARDDVGASVRRRRQALGLTLEQLAARSGVSRAMLSDVERGAKSPTIKVARSIATGLGLSLSELVSGADLGRSLVRRDERPSLVDPESGVVRQGLAPAALARGVELLAYTFPPGTDSATFPLHAPGTLKVVVVVEGALRATVGEARHDLRPGDALTFPSSQPYLLRNAGRAPCTVHMAILHPSAAAQPAHAPRA